MIKIWGIFNVIIYILFLLSLFFIISYQIVIDGIVLGLAAHEINNTLSPSLNSEESLVILNFMARSLPIMAIFVGGYLICFLGIKPILDKKNKRNDDKL